jgi:hypothetical protein
LDPAPLHVGLTHLLLLLCTALCATHCVVHVAQVSRVVSDNGVFNVKTDLPSLSASGSYGAVLPGTVVTDRDSGDSDNNVVFRTNQPALFGYFGKRKQ